MTTFRIALATLGIMGGLFAGGQLAFAAEDGVNVSEAETQTGEAVAKTYALARDLVEYAARTTMRSPDRRRPDAPAGRAEGSRPQAETEAPLPPRRMTRPNSPSRRSSPRRRPCRATTMIAAR